MLMCQLIILPAVYPPIPYYPLLFITYLYTLFPISFVLLDEDAEDTLNGDTPKSPPGRPQRKEKKEFPVSVYTWGKQNV